MRAAFRLKSTVSMLPLAAAVLCVHAYAGVSYPLGSARADVWTIEGNHGKKVGIPVPHVMNRYGAGYDTQLKSSVFTYERGFDVPPEIQSLPRKFIRFERSNWRTTVYVNQRKVGSHDGGFHAFEVDVTHALKARGNHLRVIVEDYHAVVDAPHGPNKQSRLTGAVGFNGGWNFLRGIHDQVYLVGRGHVYLDEYFAWGTMRGEDKPDAVDKKTIHARTGMHNASGKTVTAKAVYTFKRGDKVEKVLMSGPVVLPAGRTVRFDCQEQWDHPRLWWPDNPILYDASVCIEVDGKKVDEERFEFGFRDFYCRNEQYEPYKDGQGAVIGDMWLNGKRIRLRADSYFYDEWPKKFILPDNVWDASGGIREALEVSKAHNINCVRLHGGDFPESFLRAADRVGMLIIYELFSGSHPPGTERYFYDYSNPALWKTLHDQFVGKTKDHRQHPSLILWSAGNEVRFMAKRTGVDKNDPGFLKSLAGLATPVFDNDPSREVYFEADLLSLHPYNDKLFVVNGHYVNSADIRNRTGLPFIDAWRKMVSDTHWFEGAEHSQEVYRTGNDFPFGLGEYFWCGQNGMVPRAQLYGGFGVTTKSRLKRAPRVQGDTWLCYQQNMNYRTFRNWDHFGNFAATHHKDKLACMKVAYRPVVAYCRNHSDAFYGGQKVIRDFVIMNDSLDDAPLLFRVRVDDDGGREIYARDETFHLPAGELAEYSVDFRMPAFPAVRTCRMTYDLLRHGTVVDRNVRTLYLAEGDKMRLMRKVYYFGNDPVLAGIRARFSGDFHDLQGSDGRNLDAGGVLLLRERKNVRYDAKVVTHFLERGGLVVYLAEDPDILRAPPWLEAPPTFPLNLSRRPPRYSIAFKNPFVDDPAMRDVVDTDLISAPINSTVPYGDLRFWGRDNLIAKKCIAYMRDPAFRALVRATSGRLPKEAMRKRYHPGPDRAEEFTNVLLARISQGKGSVIYSTLLLAEKLHESPNAAKILAALCNH